MVIANSNPQNMVPEPREQYISPACEVLEIKPEGLIAKSPDYDDAHEIDW